MKVLQDDAQRQHAMNDAMRSLSSTDQEALKKLGQEGASQGEIDAAFKEASQRVSGTGWPKWVTQLAARSVVQASFMWRYSAAGSTPPK